MFIYVIKRSLNFRIAFFLTVILGVTLGKYLVKNGRAPIFIANLFFIPYIKYLVKQKRYCFGMFRFKALDLPSVIACRIKMNNDHFVITRYPAVINSCGKIRYIIILDA